MHPNMDAADHAYDFKRVNVSFGNNDQNNMQTESRSGNIGSSRGRYVDGAIIK